MNSQPTFLFLTYFNSMNYGHLIKSLALRIFEAFVRFARDSALENSADSYLCFQLASFHSVSYFFFLYRSLSSSVCTVFESISSNVDELSLINPSAMIVFAYFNRQSIIRTG